MPQSASPIDTIVDGMRRFCNPPHAPHHRPTAPHTPDQADEPQSGLPTVPASEGRHVPAGEAGGGLLSANEPPAALANLSPLTAAIKDRSASISWDSMSSNAAAVHEHAACQVGAVRPLTGTSYVPFAPQTQSAIAPEMPPARAAAAELTAAIAGRSEMAAVDASAAVNAADAAPCLVASAPPDSSPAAEPPFGPDWHDFPAPQRSDGGALTPPAPEGTLIPVIDAPAAAATARAAARTTRFLAQAPATGAIPDFDLLQQTPAVLYPATQFARDRPTPPPGPAAESASAHDPASGRGPSTGSSRRSLEGAFLSATNSAPAAAAEQPVWLSQAAACCAAVDTSVDTSDVDYIDQLEHQVHTLKRANEQLTTEARAAQAAYSRTTARTSHAALADPPTRSVRRRAGAELSDYCSGADVARSSRRRVDGGPRDSNELAPSDWDDWGQAPSPSHAPPQPPPPPPPDPPRRLPAPAAAPDPLSGLVPDPACALVVAPRRPPSIASDPPLDPPSADHLVAFHSSPQPQQPAWYAPVRNQSGVIVTDPLLPWRQAVALAPQTPAFAKLRAQESPANSRMSALLTAMASNPGMVASLYTRALQLLVDQHCGFFYLNHADDSAVLNGETLRFLADACTNIEGAEVVRTCYLESSSTFSKQQGFDASAPTYTEELLRYVLRMLVLELAPPFAGTLEVAFNRNTRLRPGDTIIDFLKAVRRAASEGTIPEHVVKSRLVSVIQEAADHANVDRHVLNAVTNHITDMMARSTSVHALQQTVMAASSVGGYLTEPIIRAAPAPPPVLAPAPPLVPAGGFLASTAASPPDATPPPPSAGSLVPSAFYTPPQGGDRPARPPRPAYDLTRAYPLLFGPNTQIPPIRGSLDCRVCVELDGKTLVTWYEGCERPKPESKQKFGHDPWCCAAVGYHMQQRRAAGDTRFTEALCRGVLGKPATAADFPQE